MTYTRYISVTAQEAIERAKRIASGSSKYILGAGGRNPQADTPFTSKNGVSGSDCIGFVLWCLGLDRLQPDYPFYEGWINTDSMILDVEDQQTRFKEAPKPFPGCAVVYPSIWKDGKMARMGHIGLVVEVPANFPSDWKHLSLADRKYWMDRVTVIDCAAAIARKLTGKAVGKRSAKIWATDGMFVAYKHQAPELERVPQPDEIMTSPKLGYRLLKLTNPFMRGQDVLELQRRLGITMDGAFGPETESFVRKFQLKNKLLDDGIVGPATLLRLL